MFPFRSPDDPPKYVKDFAADWKAFERVLKPPIGIDEKLVEKRGRIARRGIRLSGFLWGIPVFTNGSLTRRRPGGADLRIRR